MRDMNLSARTFGLLGSLLGLTGVALGAFGAHVLEGRLLPAELAVFETAARYQMFHALALLAVALLGAQRPTGAVRLAGWAFLSGTVVFSGSLYLLSFTGVRWLGAVTPLGGVAFLVGWVALGWGFLRGDGPGAQELA